jgi:NTE family protein
MPVKTMKLDYETIALVLQGGGSLGAYQAGVYEGLDRAGIRCNWIAGISIGAVNAALIAGNAPDDRLEKLKAFWEMVCRPNTVGYADALAGMFRFTAPNPLWRELASFFSAMMTTLQGQRGFFKPRLMPPWSPQHGDPEAASIYDVSDLRATVERFVDFDRINSGETRLSLGAVNVATGNFKYFDSQDMARQGKRLGPEHVMASSALPPAFAPVEIDGEYYWDGGVVSNTPLEFILETLPRRDTLAFQVDLWSARGDVPDNIPDVLERQKDIQYSSRTRRGTDQTRTRQSMRLAIDRALRSVSADVRGTPEFQALDNYSCTKVFNIIHLIYQSKSFEKHFKDYEFSPQTMQAHWSAGLQDMRTTLKHPEFFTRPSALEGVVTHDIHRKANPESGRTG